jgi:hypothetical protein
MKMKKLPVGISDFKKIIEDGYHYVDKSLFIKEILDKGDSIMLIPRPRRFGKTLNLSMLKYFYDCCPADLVPGSAPPEEHTGAPDHTYRKLFASLAIEKAGSEYMDKLGRHPVIFLSFRGIKELDWDSCFNKIKELVQEEYLKHDYLLNSPKIKAAEKKYIGKIIDIEGNLSEYENSLGKLLIFLSRHYGKRAVILIDEYDAPIHAGFAHDYYDEIINFMRNYLCSGLKDTDPYLEKSVLTGIMRIAKESIFSGLNNPGVYTLLSAEFDDKFGFTEQEVETMLDDYHIPDMLELVREWYNGYRFGKKTIYNPWSIVNFLGSKENELETYWINTSDNKIVEFLLSKGGKELKLELEQLIRGETIDKAIEKDIVLKDIENDEDLLWSFLLMGGYLKQTGKRRNEAAGKTIYSLSIPNREVRSTYTRIIGRYFSGKIDNRKLEIMLKALLDGNIDLFGEIFCEYVINAMSFFDTAAEPEKVYHAFVMGLLLWITPEYEVKSNRESGYGRYDIMIIPQQDTGKLGFIIEFKKTRKKETLKSAAGSALAQIEEKKYETELIARGIKNYKKLAIVFQGKEVVIKEAE